MADAVVAVRSRGVDVLRGATLAWLVLLSFVPGTGWFRHADWWGWGQADAFFPLFLFVAGVGLAHQTAGRRALPWGRLLRRATVLVGIGLAVNVALAAGTAFGSLRIPGVLQRIAVVGLLGAGFTAVVGRRWWAALAGAGALALAWAVILAVAASSCPGGRPTIGGCGTLVGLDEAVFGADRLYQGGTRGHDPEGLASTIGALATFLSGVAAGGALVARRADPAARRVRIPMAMAAGWLVVTPLFLAFQPVGKRLWTASFVSVTAAGGLVLLAGAVALFDGDRRRPWARRVTAVSGWPLEAVGRNALLVWVMVTLAEHVLAVVEVEAEPRLLGPWLLDAWGGPAYLAVFGGGVIVIACGLRARGWYLRL